MTDRVHPLSSLGRLPAFLRARALMGLKCRHTFGSPQGKEVFRDLMRFCGMDEDPFVPADAAQTAYNLGKRRVAMRYARFMGYDEAAITRDLEQHREIIAETEND